MRGITRTSEGTISLWSSGTSIRCDIGHVTTPCTDIPIGSNILQIAISNDRLTALISKFNAGSWIAKKRALVQARLDRVVVGVDDLVREDAVGIQISDLRFQR